MSDSTIEQARVLQFKSNVLHLYQQKGSLLKGLVREEALTGKAHFFERVSPTAATKRTTRHEATVHIDVEHSRRMVTPADYVWSTLVDDTDKLRIIINPESEYAIEGASAMQRTYDEVVIAAFDADAKSGEDGSGTVTFASEPVGSSSEDLSSGNVETADVLNWKLQFDILNIPMDNRVIVTPPGVPLQLLAATSAPFASSSDYNTVKALVRGEIDTWVGFRWVVTNIAPLLDSTDKYLYAFHRDSMGIAVARDMVTKMDVLPERNYNTQLYIARSLGATRIQKGVLRSRVNSSAIA